MPKLYVIDRSEDGRSPFLRGILTRSLQDAGLPFEESFAVATAVRDALADVKEIPTSELRAKVAEHLAPFDDVIARRYAHPVVRAPTIYVRYTSGQTSPFSRGRHRLALETIGLSPEEATAFAAHTFTALQEGGRKEIAATDLTRLTYDRLRRDRGPDAAQRYLVWEQFRHSGRPMIVLIGGTSGSGKSTISAQIAHRLDIVRTESTDMLREVMRMMVPESMLPVLHTSSYKAWQALPGGQSGDAAPHSPVTQGYLTQAEMVSVACTAVIQRAIKERVSLVLEGIHVHPLLLNRIPHDTDAIIVPIMLGMLRSKELKHRLHGRGKRTPGRRARRYLENFDAIWALQEFLLSEADDSSFAIIQNDDADETMREVLSIIMARLAEAFAGTPEEVLG